MPKPWPMKMDELPVKHGEVSHLNVSPRVNNNHVSMILEIHINL